MPTKFWKQNVNRNGVTGRENWDLTLFSLCHSMVKALMSFENMQKSNSKKNKDLDKGIHSSHGRPLDRLQSGIPWLRGKGGLK